MKRHILFLILLAVTAALQAQKLVSVGEGYSKTSVNTAIFRTNSLVTDGDKQYISYYDPDGYVVVGRRKLGTDRWTLQRTQFKGKVEDAHNVISMMVDGDGYIHLSFDHHGNPLRYCRSVAPDSLSFGELEPMTGRDEEDVTYPEFYRLADGDLLFVYREGASGRGNMVMNRYYTHKRRWERVQSILIDGENQRNAYWQLYVDGQGTIHVSWVWRETWMVETNHDLCYARSHDGGRTWERSDGTTYKLPIRADNAEYICRIPQGSELINQTSMTADDNGNPYIATYWRDADSDVPQYRIVWNDGSAWHSEQVSHRTTPFSLSGGGTKMIPIARPRLVANKGEVLYIVRDAEQQLRAALYSTSHIGSGEWKLRELTDFSVDAWEPTIDSELWKSRHQLHLFLQTTSQGDAEKTVETEPTMVSVMEVATDEAQRTRQLIDLVNRHWQQNNSPEVRSFWDNAAYHTGNMEAYRLTGNEEYLNYSLRWAEHNEWKGAKSNDKSRWKMTYGESDDYVLFGDYQICFQTYADLYNILPDEKRIARAREVMEYEMSTPRHDYWWWSDGLYMVMPVMTKLYRITGNELYLDKLYEYISYSDSIMFDADENLYYRDAKYVYPAHKTNNGKKDFWARGDGWVVAGLAKVLQDLPRSNAHYEFFANKFREMCAAVAAIQQPEGYWTRSMMDPEQAPGAETSGTAFFAYGIMWGINNGYLDEATYMPVFRRAWSYLSEQAVRADGTVGYVQPIGERAIPGQVVDANSTANFGVGAFLLAACEYVRYLEAGNNADRRYWTSLAYKMAYPVLSNMAKGELQKNMQVEVSPTWDGRDRRVTYMECFGRLMAGIAPWFSLPDDDSEEGKMRSELRGLALKSYANAVDPQSPDYLLWHKEGQPLVDAAYIAESFLRAYGQLWEPLDEKTKQRYVEEFTQMRRVDPPYTNWLLFSSTIESFLAKAGAKCDAYRVNSAIRKVEEWYTGDGWYSDGPSFAFDYYSSYVFHPMYLETLQTMDGANLGTRLDYRKYYNRALRRTQKFSLILERFISPEGTFPVFGRSIPYRMATMQPLALMAWYDRLPAGVSRAQVRCALTAVMRRMFADGRNFNESGFLTIGFCGNQPNIADWYTNNGSLYMTSLSFLPLALPASHPFWTDAPQPWTSVRAWGGSPFPKDHVWKDEIQTWDLY